jgi:hypothetical protein
LIDPFPVCSPSTTEIAHLPRQKKIDLGFAAGLNPRIRLATPSLAGRNHLAWRSQHLIGIDFSAIPLPVECDGQKQVRLHESVAGVADISRQSRHRLSFPDQKLARVRRSRHASIGARWWATLATRARQSLIERLCHFLRLDLRRSLAHNQGD